MKRICVGIILLYIAISPISGEELAIKDNFSIISFGLSGGYTISDITGFGGDIEGPAFNFALQISPSLIDFHPFHLNARLDLSGNIAFGKVWNQASADIVIDCVAGVFLFDMFYLYTFGGGGFHEYGIWMGADDTQSAVEHGFGYRYGGGLQFVIVSDKTDYIFIGPEITAGKMFLNTVDNNYIRFNFAVYFHMAVK
jgi:hypothetical protein